MALQGSPVLGFDTETTGVDVTRDRIVTTALVLRRADGTVEERTWLIDPGVEIPAQATAVHGITTAQARAEGRDAAEGLEEIAEAVAAALRDGVPVLAFNAAFDLRILDADLARHALPGLEERLGRSVEPVVDPLVIDRGVDRFRRGKRKLVDLMAVYGVEPSDSLHDALEDVRQSIAVFDAIMAKYPKVTALSLADLHAWERVKHREWAEGFNKFLASKGKPADVDLTWP